MKQKERLIEVDIMRAIAFLSVVFQHTIGGIANSDTGGIEVFIAKFLFCIAKTGVPVFLFLTGISLMYTYGEGKFDIKDFYIKKLKFLLLPFLIWSLFYIFTNNNNDFEIGFNQDTFLTIITGDSKYHLWYMGMLIRIYLYFPLFLFIGRWLHKQKKVIRIAAFLFFTAAYLHVLNHYEILSETIAFLFGDNPTPLQEKLVNVTPLYYIYYFILGAYAAFNYKWFKEKILKYKFVFIGVYILTLAYSYYEDIAELIGNPLGNILAPLNSYVQETSVLYRSFTMFFLYLAAYLAAKSKILTKILVFISAESFMAYLIHIAVANALVSTSPMCYIVSGHEWILFMFTAAISIIISYLFTFIPYSRFITGKKSVWSKSKKFNFIENRKKPENNNADVKKAK